MSKLYNMGCSFAYGNCVPRKNHLCDEHISPGTLVAKHLGLKEVNLAVNGNSLDGVLRRLYTYDFEKDGVILIGVPPSGRFQIVSYQEQVHNKIRGGQSERTGKGVSAKECIKYGFSKGPAKEGDFFKTNKWPEISVKKMDLNETASYYLHFNLAKIQSRLKELGLKSYIYNSIKFTYGPKNLETALLKRQIDISNYYKPESDMFAIVKSDSKYELADGDQHPNHLAYHEWAKGFCSWLDERMTDD